MLQQQLHVAQLEHQLAALRAQQAAANAPPPTSMGGKFLHAIRPITSTIIPVTPHEKPAAAAAAAVAAAQHHARTRQPPLAAPDDLIDRSIDRRAKGCRLA